MRRIQAAERVLVVFEKAAVVLALTLMLTINVCQVLGRHLGFEALGRWTDLLLALLPWLGMVGASIGVHLNRHIGFMSLRQSSPRVISGGMRIVAGVSMVGFFSVMIVSGFQAVHDQYLIGGASPQLGIPRWVVTAAVPTGGLLMAIHAVIGFVAELRDPEKSDHVTVSGTEADEAPGLVSLP